MTRTDDSRASGEQPDYDAMQRGIRAHQSRIDETLTSLRSRLAPRNLKEQTMNRMTKSVNSGASSMGDMVRGNPIPLAMIGIGVGWMLLSRSGMDQRIANSRALSGVRSSAGSTARYARDTFYSAAESVRDAAGNLYSRSGETGDEAQGGTDRGRGSADFGQRSGRSPSGGSMTGSMGRQVGRVTTSFWELVDDHPLVAGVMGVALGAAIGASIPSTRYEERWVGDYAGQMTDRAKELAQDAVDRGARAARAAAEAARDQLTEAVDDIKDAAKEEMNRPS